MNEINVKSAWQELREFLFAEKLAKLSLTSQGVEQNRSKKLDTAWQVVHNPNSEEIEPLFI